MRTTVLSLALLVPLSAQGAFSITRACTPQEHWQDVPEAAQALKAPASPIRHFAEALSLRRHARNPSDALFAEYAISHALWEGKLLHLAWNGFAVLATRPWPAQKISEENPDARAILTAAVECLNHLQDLEFSLPYPSALEDLPFSSNPVLMEAAGRLARQEIAAPQPSPQRVERLLAKVREAESETKLDRGLWAARRLDHGRAASLLSEFVTAPAPAHLQRYRDSARLLLARSLYHLENYGEAIAQFQKLPKNSNDLPETLSELAWAFLQDGRYNEAIGTGIALNTGGLQHTFTPEAPMVMAMAFNEICQFPGAIRAMESFRRDYSPSHRWLTAYRDEDLYPEVLKFIRHQSTVPERIAGEWVRSPIFLSHQQELNSLVAEGTRSQKLGPQGAKEQRQLMQEILSAARRLKHQVLVARMKLKAGDPLPNSITSELSRLRSQVVTLHRLQAAAPIWKRILEHQHSVAAQERATLLVSINGALRARTRYMKSQLDEITENLELVDAEIFQGASADIVWQNAHPDYQQVAAHLPQSEKGENGVRPQAKWDWGRAPASSGEIWEDELGSFQTDLFDNCSSKEKYLALRRRGL